MLNDTTQNITAEWDTTIRWKKSKTRLENKAHYSYCFDKGSSSKHGAIINSPTPKNDAEIQVTIGITKWTVTQL